MSNGAVKLESVSAKVRKAYCKNNKVISDDALLLNEVYKLSGWDKSKTLLKNLRAMPKTETIFRAKRELVACGLIGGEEE